MKTEEIKNKLSNYLILINNLSVRECTMFGGLNKTIFIYKDSISFGDVEYSITGNVLKLNINDDYERMIQPALELLERLEVIKLDLESKEKKQLEFEKEERIKDIKLELKELEK